MSLESGRTLLHYRIVDKIGAGGMGEVWRAVDTELEREVAIKVLPRDVATDPERLGRFEREARTLASFSHPNIATVHGLHSDGETRFLSMELVPGTSLARRIERGPLAVDEALAIARGIAEALETAHEHGVVHRDLKPANVMLTPDGTVKVLDFGLAKMLGPDGPDDEGDPSASPTITSLGTTPGLVLGTAGYMSPEQARGQAVDRRADIWAFGVVCYEMLTGAQPFIGDTISDTLAAVLRADIDVARLPGDLPRDVRRVLLRCLERDPRRRLRDVGEVRVALEDLERGGGADEDAAVDAPAAGSRGRLGLVLAVAAALVVGAVAGALLRPRPAAAAERKLTLAPPGDIEGPRLEPRLSPDGRTMAYVAEGRLWLQSLDSLTAQPVTGGEAASAAAWAPDSSALAFTVRNALWRTRPGGDPARIAELPDAIGGGGALTWTDDDRIVYATGDNNLFEVPVAGGVPRVLLAPDPAVDHDFHDVTALPGGGLVFVVHRREGSIDTIHGYRDGERIPLVQVPDGTIEHPAYSPTGHLLYSLQTGGSGVWAVPFSLSRFAVTGEPFRVADDGNEVTAARDGSLLYSNASPTGNHQLVVLDAGGTIVDTIGTPLAHADNARLSPDGTRLAVCVLETSGQSIWVYDLREDDARSRITWTGDCGGARGRMSWTADGRAVGLADPADGAIRLVSVDGSAPERALAEGEQPTFGEGDAFVFVRVLDDGTEDLWVGSLRGDADPRPYLELPGRQSAPVLSPRGGLVAYASDETGRTEVFVRTFPDPGGAWQVSTSGGTFPRWSSDGTKLYYLEAESDVMAADVATGTGVRISSPRRLFSGAEERLGPDHGWDVGDIGDDRERFVTVRTADSGVSSRDLTLITNWAPASR